MCVMVNIMNSGALFHCLHANSCACYGAVSLLSRCSPYCAAFLCTILLTTLMQALAVLSTDFSKKNFTDLIKWRGRFWMSDVLMFVAAEIRLINSESPWHWRHWPGAVPLFALRINVVTNNRNSGRCTGDPLLCSLNNGRISIDFHMLTTDVFSWSQMLLATL